MVGPKPTVGRVVHYVSYGTPGGEHPSECCAAIVTTPGDEAGKAALCVLYPNGLSFKENVQHNESNAGGTWHWPERVPVYR
jgi:hypothetical protein